MKVRMTVDVDEHARYVIARYYQERGGQHRARCTRKDAQRFMQAATRLAVRELGAELRGKAAGTARKLKAAAEEKLAGAPEAEVLVPARERQRDFLWPDEETAR